MSTYILKLFERLENTKIYKSSGSLKGRMERINTEQCFCGLYSVIDDGLTEKCSPLAIFNELWGWYCGGTEDGVWQYFEHSIKAELIAETADVLKKYGCEEFADQYINAGKELMPLMEGELPYKDADLINKISESYGSYIDSHANEICIVMKNFLLDHRDEICDILADANGLQLDDVFTGAPSDDFYYSLSNPDLSSGQRAELSSVIESFSGFLDNPEISDEQRSDLAAVIGRMRGIDSK